MRSTFCSLVLALLGGIVGAGNAFAQYIVPVKAETSLPERPGIALAFDDGGIRLPAVTNEPSPPKPLPAAEKPLKKVEPAPEPAAKPLPAPEPAKTPREAAAKPIPTVAPEPAVAPPAPKAPAERPKAELNTGLTPPAPKAALPADDRPKADAKAKTSIKPLPLPPSLAPAAPTVTPPLSRSVGEAGAPRVAADEEAAYDSGQRCGGDGADGSAKRSAWTPGGWIDQGITFLGARSADGYNGVVTFPDRDREYQMNQFDVFVERKVNVEGDGVDWGGRFDVLYGTDSRFVQARGLEPEWGQTEHFYQLALPQFYLDVAVDQWTIRLGHFYTTLGYESAPAPNNFFYTHSYTCQYGEPFTHTGALLSRKLGERLSISGGLHRGNDVFANNDDRWSFLGGVAWTGPADRLSLACNVTSGAQDEGNQTTIYSLVGQLKLTERLTYVLQHDHGQSDGGAAPAGAWYGLNQYWLLSLNDSWGLGTRFEWFRDRDGTRVTGLGVTNAVRGASFAGDFYELSVGLNWKPSPKVVFRPEVRWDWYDPQAAGPQLPFAAGTQDHQFLAALDLLVSF